MASTPRLRDAPPPDSGAEIPPAPPPGPSSLASPTDPTYRSPPVRRPASSGSLAAAPASVGRYTVESVLGRGGMGVVYRGFDPHLRRPVAIKMIDLDPTELEAEDLQRFVREARAAARLAHPGIVPVYEVGADLDRPYLVMGLVEGESFEEALAGGALPRRRVAEVVRDVARALDHAHGHGIIHRDVKPQNVLLDREGRALLTDFGLARDAASVRQLTLTGDILGTPAYMAPEQAAGLTDEQGPHSDVWGIGAVLYRALVGVPPFTGDTPVVILQRVLTEEPVGPRRIDPTIPVDLETIVLRCLERERFDRYESAAMVAAELERWLAGDSIRARPPGRVVRLRRWTRRNRLLTALVLVVGAAALGGAGMLVEMRRRVDAAHSIEAERARAEREAFARRVRSEADRASTAFDAALAASSGPSAPGDSEGRLDEALALGLEAMQTAWTVHAIDVSKNDARARAFATTMAFGEVALEAEQWSVAVSAFGRAATLGVADASAEAARERAVAARIRHDEELIEIVDGVLADARSGVMSTRPDGWNDALFTLVRHPGAETVRRVQATLDEATGQLRKETRAALIAAVDPGEAEPLGEAIDRWLSTPPDQEPPQAELQRAFRAAEALARSEAARGGAPREPRLALASAQTQGVAREVFETIRLCCNALGRLGAADGADEAIGRYIALEMDETRATRAVISLGRLGGRRARAILELLVRRFPPGGIFEKATLPLLQGREDTTDRDVAIAATSTAVEAITLAGHLSLRAELDAAERACDRAIALDAGFAEAWMARATVREHLGRLSEALADAERGVALAPRRAATWCTRGTIKVGLRDSEGAVVDLTRAIELDPSLGVAWSGRGDAHFYAGHFEDAIRDYDRAIEINPASVIAWRNRGVARARTGQVDAALGDLSRAIEIDDRSVEARGTRAELRIIHGDLDGAWSDAARAIELDPSNAPAWVVRGRARLLRGELEGARVDLERAVELAPGEAPIRYWNAEVLKAGGDLDAARAELDESIRLAPKNADAWLARGRLRLQARDPEGAIEDLDRAVQLAPRSAQAWARRADALRVAGRLDEASSDLARAIELDPRLAFARRVEGELLARRGDANGAFKSFSLALELDPTDAGAWLERGRLLHRAGKLRRAIADYEKALVITPRSIVALTNLGAVFGALGEHEAAIEHATRALELDPAHASALGNRGFSRHALGDLRGARADYDLALRVDPGRPNAWIGRADVRATVGDRAGALADLGRALDLTTDPAAAERVRKRIAEIQGGD